MKVVCDGGCSADPPAAPSDSTSDWDGSSKGVGTMRITIITISSIMITIITIISIIITIITSNIVTDRHCGHLLLHLWGQEVRAVPGRRHLESRHRAGVRRSWGHRKSWINDQEARKETREEAWKEARKREETREEARKETRKEARKGKETRKEAWKGKEARKREEAR